MGLGKKAASAKKLPFWKRKLLKLKAEVKVSGASKTKKRGATVKRATSKGGSR